MLNTEHKIIHGSTRDPRSGSIFSKPNRSERASLSTVSCCIAGCPLLKSGQCVMLVPLGSGCPYGKWNTSTGPTGRAAGYWEWLQDAKKQIEGVPFLSSPPTKLAFIGEYVYLPYPHASMCKEVPFLQHSSLFVAGLPFIRREDWTIETVLLLLGFRPQALIGGEIKSYQSESVPKMVAHIRECDPGMWESLIAVRPKLNVAQNYVGRKAVLRTLNSPLTFTVGHKDYPVTWTWDGESLTTQSRHAYNDTWGKLKQKSLSLKMVPEDDATLVVQGNDWVNESTVFVD